VNINTLAILGGSFPARAFGLVTEWGVTPPAGTSDDGSRNRVEDYPHSSV